MKVILTIGAPQSGHLTVFESITQAGVFCAAPCRDASLSPQSLQARLLRSMEVSLESDTPLVQLKPGRLWNELASDLFLTNIDHPVWGWADHQTTVLMDFWKDFDPQVRLLLVYNSPYAYLAEALDQHTLPTPQVVADVLNEWTRWNTALLRYCYRNPDCCVLVNAEQAYLQPQSFAAALAERWQISGLGSTTVIAAGAPAYPHLQAHLISQIIDPHHPALALHEELDAAALLFGRQSPDSTEKPTAVVAPNAATTWGDWVQVRASLAELVQEKIKIGALGEELQNARDELTTKSESHIQAGANTGELTQENELLLQQLHQVQEELETYFLKNQTLTQQAEQVDTLNAELTHVRSQCDALTDDKAALAQAHETVHAEKAAAAQAHDALQAERAHHAQQLAHQEALLSKATQASANTSELTQENELLLQQLHQVQEELEHYFLRAQSLEQGHQSKANGFVADFWRMHQPTELVINMQHNIVGSNWYPAESDGRWAGPATLSTVQMPPVQPGDYTLELDIVDAMNPGLVSTLMVQAHGQTQPVEVFYPLYQGEYPMICKVPLNISHSAADQPWAIGLRFAQTVCPADSGSDDRRNLTARLRSMKLVKQA